MQSLTTPYATHSSAVARQHNDIRPVFHIQWNLDLLFFKGVEKTNECGETINPENPFFLQKSRTLSFAFWQNFASIEI
jgi:hypothetical protein